MSTQHVHVTIFSNMHVLAVYSDRFQILQSCTLLLQLPVLTHSWCYVHWSRLGANSGMCQPRSQAPEYKHGYYESKEWYLFSCEHDVNW